MYTEISKCRICGGTQFETVMNLGEQVMTGVFPKSRDEMVTSGPVELIRCSAPEGCGLVQLRQSYDLAEMYGMNYGYRSGLNASMVAHLHSKVDKILAMDILDIGDLVIDVGSNDATTLKAYPPERFDLVGIDPTGIKFHQYYPDAIRLIPEFFSADAVSAATDGKKAKVITSFSMFYDLEDPISFAREVAGALDSKGVWIFEQSYLPAMLRTNSFDTICHEHLDFYALEQIEWIAKESGLKLLDVEFNDVNGGSFSVVAALESSPLQVNVSALDIAKGEERSLNLSSAEPYQNFCNRVEEAKIAFAKFILDAKTEGKTVAGLGASTKGNVLLQYFDLTTADIKSIGEVNPDKFGSFTPGTLIPLVCEDDLLAENPDYLVVLPWHFKDFFIKLPSMSGRTLVFPLPELTVIKVP